MGHCFEGKLALCPLANSSSRRYDSTLTLTLPLQFFDLRPAIARKTLAKYRSSLHHHLTTMAKKTAAKTSAAPAQKDASSIDDIFASSSSKTKVPVASPQTEKSTSNPKSNTTLTTNGKSSSKSDAPNQQSALSSTEPQPKKKEKNKNRKTTVLSFIPGTEQDSAGTPTERKVETVVDPSIAPTLIEENKTVPHNKVTVSAGSGSGLGLKSKKRDRKALEDEAAFRDSRGDGPREFLPFARNTVVHHEIDSNNPNTILNPN